MSGSCTDVLSSAELVPASHCIHTLEELLESNRLSESSSSPSGSTGTSRDSTGSSTTSSTEGFSEANDCSPAVKRDGFRYAITADTLAFIRPHYKVGSCLKVDRPATLAKYIRQCYPDEFVLGSKLDLLISDIEEKVTTEYLRLENGRLAWEQAIADTAKIVQEHVKLYDLELRDERMRINDTSLTEGGRDISERILRKTLQKYTTAHSGLQLQLRRSGSEIIRRIKFESWIKNPNADDSARDELINVCEHVMEPVVKSSSIEWIKSLIQLLAELQSFSANDGSKKWFFFDNAVFLMENAVTHGAEYAGRVYENAAHSKGIVQSHVLHVDSLTMKLRTAKLARLGQLNPLGVIEFVEGLFERIEGYSDHLDKIVSTADLRAQKWMAALACSSSLRDTFLGILQHPFFECVPEDVMKEFADIPNIAARTAGKLVELAATEEELPEHIFTGFYGRPSSAFLLIKPPFIGLTGEVFLTGLSQYLGIDFFLDYGCSRSD